MKQILQHNRSTTIQVEEVPPPTLRGSGLLVLNEASLISPEPKNRPSKAPNSHS
jgi:hypothetical protein